MTDAPETAPETADEPPANSYDALPYDSWAFQHTHPDRLAAFAAFFGVDAPAADTCRVLELGCAAGGNLIPMAVSLPHAQFVGVDLSAVQIADGRKVVEELSLANVDLQHRSITDVGPDDGTFDYIVCHGVYSWVPPDVQDAILAAIRDRLAPTGVAYVSYNTLPGWHLRAGVREMMQFHAERFTRVQDRIDQARALLDFLISAIPEEDQSAYATMLRDELNVVRNRADSYLFHEHLELHNEPIYFYDFVGKLRDHDLRYLGESALQEMFPRELSPKVQATLAEICPDQTHMEQYLDFLRNRMFRRTLVCHADVIPDRELDVASIESLWFGAEVKPLDGVTEDDLDASTVTGFRFDGGGTAHLEEPFGKRILRELGRAWPAYATFEALAERVESELGRTPEHPEFAADRARAMRSILELLSAGLLDFRLGPPRFATSVPERPVASPLARHQAAAGPGVTTLRHVSRSFPEHVLHLIQLADGSRTHAELAAEFADFAVEKELALSVDGVTHDDEEGLRGVMNEQIERLLLALCWDGLLLPDEAA